MQRPVHAVPKGGPGKSPGKWVSDPSNCCGTPVRLARRLPLAIGLAMSGSNAPRSFE